MECAGSAAPLTSGTALGKGPAQMPRFRDSQPSSPLTGGGGGPSKRHYGGARGHGHLATAWGFDPPVFFRCWKLTLWGPRVLGPPQLGVVVDGNATMGRPTLLLPVLGKVGSPRSARVAPPRWG